MRRNLWAMLFFSVFAMAFTACSDNGNGISCDTQNPCANDMICSDDSRCVSKSDKFQCSKMHPCAGAYSCLKDICTKDIVAETCNAQNKCTIEGQICNDLGKCVVKSDAFECGKYAICIEDLSCVEHKCVKAECSLTKKCKDGMICNDDAVCVPKDGLFECGANFACENKVLKCSDKNICVECLVHADCAAYAADKTYCSVDHTCVVVPAAKTPITEKIKYTKNWVNVLNHGAIGDGITDDTDAIQAACKEAKDSGKHLFIPSATYKITSPIELWDGAIIQGEGTWGAHKTELRPVGCDGITGQAGKGAKNAVVSHMSIFSTSDDYHCISDRSGPIVDSQFRYVRLQHTGVRGQLVKAYATSLTNVLFRGGFYRAGKEGRTEPAIWIQNDNNKHDGIYFQEQVWYKQPESVVPFTVIESMTAGKLANNYRFAMITGEELAGGTLHAYSVGNLTLEDFGTYDTNLWHRDMYHFGKSPIADLDCGDIYLLNARAVGPDPKGKCFHLNLENAPKVKIIGSLQHAPGYPSIINGTPTAFNDEKIIDERSLSSSYQITAPPAELETLEMYKEEWINVKDHGAIGDGITDDTAAIHAAAAKAASYGIALYFPAGDYKITKPIEVWIGPLIQGDGAGISNIHAYGCNAMVPKKGGWNEAVVAHLSLHCHSNDTHCVSDTIDDMVVNSYFIGVDMHHHGSTGQLIKGSGWTFQTISFRGGHFWATAENRSEPALMILNDAGCQNEKWFQNQSWHGSSTMTAPFARFSTVYDGVYDYGYRISNITAYNMAGGAVYAYGVSGMTIKDFAIHGVASSKLFEALKSTTGMSSGGIYYSNARVIDP